MITVFLCASDPKAGVAGVGPLSFSANNAAQTQGATLAEWAVKKRNLKKGYVLLDEGLEYDKSVCAGYDWEYPIAAARLSDATSTRTTIPRSLRRSRGQRPR